MGSVRGADSVRGAGFAVTGTCSKNERQLCGCSGEMTPWTPRCWFTVQVSELQDIFLPCELNLHPTLTTSTHGAFCIPETVVYCQWIPLALWMFSVSCSVVFSQDIFLIIEIFCFLGEIIDWRAREVPVVGQRTFNEKLVRMNVSATPSENVLNRSPQRKGK